MTQEACSWLLFFEIASSSELEVESANGSKQYDKDETPKCHVWSEPVLWKPGQFINSVIWLSVYSFVFQFHFMVFISLQGDREQVHLEFTHDELYAFYNQVCGFCLLIINTSHEHVLFPHSNIYQCVSVIQSLFIYCLFAFSSWRPFRVNLIHSVNLMCCESQLADTSRILLIIILLILFPKWCTQHLRWLIKFKFIYASQMHRIDRNMQPLSWLANISEKYRIVLALRWISTVA